MKKVLISTGLLAVLVAVVGVSNVRAGWRGFSGSANYGAINLSSPEVKDNDSMYSYVKWETSNKSGHKMWFTLKDVNKNAKGKILIKEPTGKEEKFETQTHEDSKYHIWGNRENFWDPSTYVTGQFKP